VETCHQFVFRWCVAKGYIAMANPANPAMPGSPQMFRQVLFTIKGAPARVGSAMMVRTGMILGFWNGADLMHSMIALSPTKWIGANNVGCFGTSGRLTRQSIKNIHRIVIPPPYPPPNGSLGWWGDGNDWLSPYGVLQVTCKYPPKRSFP
jgi:hypothetical protein